MSRIRTMDGPSAETLRDILRSGIAAPSAENRHWLRFEPQQGGIDIVSTDVHTWSAEPHRAVLARLSCGAVVENMRLRAAALGHAQTALWTPQPARPELMAHCRWTAADARPDPLAEAIERRHTNRRFYRRSALGPAMLERIAAAAQDVPAARLLWMDEPALRRAALSAVRLAETERFRREGLHRELFGAIRFDVGWRRSVEEGLAPGALEVEPPMRAPFAALRRWPLMRACTRLGLHHALGLRAADMPCRLAPHVGLVACRGASREHAAFDAGRALQRAWLAATVEGLAFQPMAAAVALLHQRAGGEWVSPEVQARLAKILDSLIRGRADTAWMLFRVGHARPPSVTAQRPPLERFLAA